MAFIGDSLAQNQLESLVCLLSGVSHPIFFSPFSSEFQACFPFIYFSLSIKIGGEDLTFGGCIIGSDVHDMNSSAKIMSNNSNILPFRLSTKEFLSSWTCLRCQDSL